MEAGKPKFEELFEQAINYPDPDMQERLAKLVGLDAEKEHLTKTLGLLVNPEGLKKWVNQYHPKAKKITDIVLRRPPLIVLAGDVGSGKSELASTIADAVARQEKIDITLFPLSLSTRGNGMVGQMTQLISAAFDYTVEKAKKLQSDTGKKRGAVILLVDEADSLAQSRESSQMHHEDKAGVNAFIRGVDSLGNGKLPAAVIMCTNRPNALDPAIKRRAADIFYFKRPSKIERHKVLFETLSELGIKEKDINEIVDVTGSQGEREYGFTYSDLIQRLIPTIILDAYPNKAVTGERGIEIAKSIIPTPPFKEQ
jgi:SpoVK/Ycf46/Vps4 family AAA+-type ATPase